MELDHRRRVIFYGDSNTYGYDPADLADMRYSWSQRWTSIAAERLKGQFEVIPEGMNGRKLPDYTGLVKMLKGIYAPNKDTWSS